MWSTRMAPNLLGARMAARPRDAPARLDRARGPCKLHGVKSVTPWLKRLAQVVVLGFALWYLLHFAAAHRAELAGARLTIAWTPLVAGSVLTLLGYAWNVRLWSWSLGWWRQRLRWTAALRIWFLANLARFIPGTVWQFAGLAAMSRAEGVSAVAATTAILVQQLSLLVTGGLAALVTAPELLSAWSHGVRQGGSLSALAAAAGALGDRAHALPAVARVAIVVLLFAAGVLAVPLLLPPMARLARRMGKGGDVVVPTPTTPQLGGYVAAHLITWALYAIAFWLFCRGTFGDDAPALAPAMAAFLVSYVAGIVIVVAPGGLGVREAVLTATLSPVIGAERALLVSLLSRAWLVATELAGALVVLVLTSRLTTGSAVVASAPSVASSSRGDRAEPGRGRAEE